MLEIGPDESVSSLRQRIADRSVTWHTVDIEPACEPTFLASSEYCFPIPSDSYDVVLSANVIEHVRKVWLWMAEIARVCKPGGLVITLNPVSWPYHEAPCDCWRMYPEAMRALYDHAGLDVQLSVWESLETPQYRRYIPGLSAADQGWKRRLVYRILGPLGFPVERSYDTITIGKKRVLVGG